jgi:protein TonB
MLEVTDRRRPIAIGRSLSLGVSCALHAGAIGLAFAIPHWAASSQLAAPPVLRIEVVTPERAPAPEPPLAPPAPPRPAPPPPRLAPPRIIRPVESPPAAVEPPVEPPRPDPPAEPPRPLVPRPLVKDAATTPTAPLDASPATPPAAAEMAPPLPPPTAPIPGPSPGPAPRDPVRRLPEAAAHAPAGSAPGEPTSRADSFAPRGSAGNASSGTGREAGTSAVASVPSRDAGSTSGVTQYARPQGGYQVRPRYPPSARRLGVQGTTLLRVHVLIDGRVGDVVVQESAGHPDLDQAAAEAVRRWRFDPARRGADAVDMWVLLPVEFRIR